MKKLIILAVFLITAVINSAHAGNDNKKQTKKAVNTQQLSSVSIFKNDISPEKTMEYRKEYRSKDWLVNGDIGTYSFSNIPEFYLTTTVYRGAGQVAILEKDIDKSLLSFMTDTDIGKMPLKDLIKNKQARIQGVLIIHDGKIVLEEYPGMRELDKHCWFSASKQLMGLTVHILEEEGAIDLEQTVNYYIPEYDSDDWKKVKVKHLLHHVSGMDYVETNANFANPAHPLNKAVSFSLSTRYEEQGESVFDLMKGVKSYIEPGVKYDYSSMNTQLLGFIVERVTGKKFEDVASELIWTQVGMESDGHYGMSSHGEPVTGGFFGSRLRDLGRFVMLYTPSWNKVTDKQIVSDTYFKKAYDTTYAPALKRGVETDKSKYFKNGQSHATYQWDLVFDDGDMFKAGRYGQGIYVSPETNTVVVFFASVYKNLLYFPGFARQLVQQKYR